VVTTEKRQGSESLDANLLLTTLIEETRQIKGKLDLIIDLNRRMLTMRKNLKENSPNGGDKDLETKNQPDSMSLLLLPSSLRKTIMILYKLEKATADQLSAESKRMRAVESAAANQLVRMGYLKKRREGRDVYFYIDTTGAK
jgi:DNA-binding transcriptional ArsR family regulator